MQLQRLYVRVSNPYRPEDAAEVAAMHQRAEQARAVGDRWLPMPPLDVSIGEAAHLAFWVATTTTGATADSVIGTVGLRRVGDRATDGPDTPEQSGLPCAEDWIRAGDVGEIRRLRVTPEWRRRGVATALMAELAAWSVNPPRLRSLVLNTTAAQLPALELYRRLGFHEVGRTYVGSFELVWMQRP